MVSTCNAQDGGTQITGRAPNVVTRTRRVNLDCGDGKSGSGDIYVYSIVLKANNGVTRRLPFYKLTENWLAIGWQGYTADDG